MADPTPRLGAIDRCALKALQILLEALDKDDDFSDMLEEYLVETNTRAADLVDMDDDSEAMDEFYRLVDRFRDRTLRRTGQALADLFRPPPPVLPGHLQGEYVPRPSHPVAQAYEQWLAEQAAQT